jgi:2-polyprenyl-6-methoxyphenol hydroxylase-like FAD-dependent oxidoreductase
MRILVSGAGIGGSAATIFLKASGHDVVTIDKAPAFSRRGYILSLKYFGLGIMKSLGLYEELKRAGIPFHTIQIRDGRGNLVREFSEDMAEQATKGTIFLQRPDLHQVLYSATTRVAPVRFGTHITGIAQNNGTANVTFSDGRNDSFDLVVISEGLHSSTRRLLWEDEGVHRFDIIYAATMIDADHAIPFQVFQFHFLPGAALLFMPVSEKQVLLQCYFRGYLNADDPQSQIAELLQRHCAHLPQYLRDVMDRVARRGDMFCDNVGMVTLPDLVCGRAVVLGDSGYCPTFLSGMGASLALLGAKGLDQCLTKSPNELPHALAAYNAIMQPVISHYQQNARVNVERMVSESALRTMLHDLALRFFPPSVMVKQMAHQHDFETSLLQEFGDLKV